MLCAARSTFAAGLLMLFVCIFSSVAAFGVVDQSYDEKGAGLGIPVVEPLPVDCDDLAKGDDLDRYSQWLWFNQISILHAHIKGDTARIGQIYRNLEECKYARDSQLRSALADYTLAVIRRYLGDADGAIAGFTKLLNEKALEGAPIEKLAAFIHLYSLLGRNGQEEEAISALTSILAAKGPNIPSELKFMAAHSVAVASEILGRAGEARRYYELALQFQAESSWARLLWPNVASQLSERRYFFDNFMDFLLNSGDHEAALALAEISQGNLLLDTIRSSESTARLQRSWLLHYKLIKDLSYQKAFDRYDKGKQDGALLDTVIMEVASDLVRLGSVSDPAQIELSTAEDFQFVRASLSSFKAAKGEAYLYVLDLGHFPAAVLLKTSNGLRAARLSKPAVELIPKLEVFSLCLRNASCGDWKKISSELYSVILGGFDGSLTDLRAIHVFATGVFRGLTFEALIGGKKTPLGVQAEITYSPGIRYLRMISERGRVTSRSALIGVVTGESPPDLSPLENSVLGRRCKGRSFHLANKSHSEGSFASLADDLAAAELIFISAHGWFFRDFPLLSGFELTDNAGKRAFLPSYKLGLLSFNSSLAVLSSCQLGLTYLNSFGEAFFPPVVLMAAGSDSVLAASGDVPEKSTDRLVSVFLKYYGRRATAAEALRKARGAVWKEQGKERHPIHWSLVSLFGRGDKKLCD